MLCHKADTAIQCTPAVVLLYCTRLEMVIAESGSKDGPHLDADEEHPEGVYFTMHK